MKNKIRNLSFLVVVALTLIIGFRVNENTASAAVTPYYYYLQTGDTLKINTSGIKKPTLDWANMNDGVKFGYKKNDSTRYVTLTSDRTSSKEIQAGNATGVYTFYINKDGSTNNDKRVKQINVYVYAKPQNNATTKLTNSTSTTNGSKVNQPIYLYKGQTSTITVSQNTWGPTNTSNDSNIKAKAIYTSSYTSSNTNVATISASGSNYVVKAGNTVGSSKIRVTRRWINSNGIVHETYTDIWVYTYEKPSISLYKIDGNKEYLCTGNQYFSWQDIGGMTHAYKYMYKATYPSGMALKSVECTTTDKNTLGISTSLPYVTFSPKAHFTGQGVTFAFLINSPVRDHNGDSASTIKLTYNASFVASDQSYATGIAFKDSTATTTLSKVFAQVATVSPSNAIDKTVYYSVSDTDIATIDKFTGVITPKKHGAVKVYAKSATNEKVNTSYTLTIIPDIPTNLSVSSTDDGNKLIWNAVEGATSYDIYRATVKDGTYTKIGSTSVLFYVDGKTNYGIPYFYKIVATDGRYKSDSSSIVSTTRTLNTPRISAIKKVGTGIYQITVKGSLYDGFKIYSVNSTGAKTLLVSTTSNYATVGLDSNKSYTLVVRAYKDVNGTTVYSPYSSEIKITVNKDGSLSIGDNTSGNNNNNNGNNSNNNNNNNNGNNNSGKDNNNNNNNSGKDNNSGNTNNGNNNNKNNQTIINYLTTNNIQYVIKNNKVVIKSKPKKFKVKRINSKKMKITWKKNKKINSDIQIKYSTKKKYPSSKTHFKLVNAGKGKTTIGGLSKNKTYYVKIRYRKNVNGVYVYSPYTKVKVVKLKNKVHKVKF